MYVKTPDATIGMCLPPPEGGNLPQRFKWWKNQLLARLPALLVLLCSICFGTSGQAQNVTLKMDNVPVQKVFKEVSRQTGISLVYSESMFKDFAPVSIDVKNATVATVLDKCLQGQPFSYTISGNSIIIKKNPPPAKPAKNSGVEPTLSVIRGVVKNAQGQPMESASVEIISPIKAGTYADTRGNFTFNEVSQGKYTIRASSVGYEKMETTVKATSDTVNVAFVLKEAEIKSEDVVVNGIFARPKENFTGAAVSFTGDQLREISPTSILTALSTLDAAFQMPQDNINGSNPNSIPQVQLRGTNSVIQTDLTSEYGYISNPPLIIIDGFEAPLQRLFDMDINIIARITVLKDAAATAIYGAKSANGVLVIETKRPKRGEVQVNYTANLQLDLPDLSSYNMMDAKEKLAFEEKAGVYRSPNFATQQKLTDQYNLVKHNIERGVNTYWMAQPLQSQFNQTHSLNLGAGSEHFLYQGQLRYGHDGGIMKGSKRDNLSGNIFIGYTSKKFKFNYQFLIGTTNGTNSPYGSFDSYTRMNPYWLPKTKYGTYAPLVDIYPVDDVDGQATSLHPESYISYFTNPLYNTTLNTIDKTSTMNLQQNFWAEWALTRDLKVNATLTVQSANTETDAFLPAKAVQYYFNTDFATKGTYSKGTEKTKSTQGSANLNYGKTFGKHTVFATGGLNLQQNSMADVRINVQGFPSERLDDLLFGLQYSSTKPNGGYTINRIASFYGNTSYAYDNRYLLDLSYRADGASIFGSNKRFGQLWSIGAGWNLHKEKFLHLPKAIGQFKLRGSYGYTGSVEFPGYASTTTYNYITSGSYLNYVPANVTDYGNPDLLWQRTKKLNLGADIGLFKNNRVFLSFNYYREITDDLIMSNETAPSTGFSSFYNNLGKSQNTGVDVSLTTVILKNPAKRLHWSIQTSWFANQNKLLKITDVLAKQNDNAKNDQLDTSKLAYGKPIMQYQEGASVSTLYAVRSLGIDPSTGYEVFLTKDGKQTYVWSQKDLVAMGDLQPKFNITFTNYFQFKWIKLNFGLNVQLGGVQYNSTLASQVENLNPRLNVDRRAGEGRWLQPGDVSDYKGLVDINGYTRTDGNTNATSRFVKKNAAVQLTGLTIDPGALLSQYITKYTNLLINKVNDKAKDVIKSDMIDVRFMMSNLINFSSINKQRGTAYPFNRSFSLNINVRF